jgi:hypothetical protein
VRRVPHHAAHAMTAEKVKATPGSDILPHTIQHHQKRIHGRKRRIWIYLPFYRFFRQGSNGGRRTQLDQRRGRFGTHTVKSAMFDALKVLASIFALYMIRKSWFLGMQEQGFGATSPSHLSRPIAVVIRTRTSQRSSHFYMPLSMDSEAKEEVELVDYGELNIHIFEEDGQQRNIYHDSLQDKGDEGDDSIAAAADDEHDYYYAFDDDAKRNPYIGWDDDKSLQDEKQCRRVNWHRLLLLNCNSFHELGLASNSVADFSLKG